MNMEKRRGVERALNIDNGLIVDVSYKYSHLDNRHEFGVVFNHSDSMTEFYHIYIRWVWYYLGAAFGDTKQFSLLPFSVYDGKKIKSYKYCNDAKRQAKLIVNAISNITKNIQYYGRKRK